jgi:hypothetical protein
VEEAPITSEKIAKTIKKIEERLQQKPTNRTLKKAKR